jgi:hypothetical protein
MHMANIQAQFKTFDETIRLRRFKENATLREKRDIIRRKLEINLPAVFARHDAPCPEFYFLDQGSYEMDTGVKPLTGDFDIDQGLYFKISTEAYPDPVVLKERVLEALDGHTKKVEMRRSCVTVFYQCDGEPIYHVDIAVFTEGAYNADGKDRTSKGKQHSAPEYRVWQVSNPAALTERIWEKYTGEDRAQFRRVVRYWKRWRDVNFDDAGNGKPNGIGLTVLTYDRLVPTYSDPFVGTPDDLRAMLTLVEATLARFQDVWDETEQRFVRRLVVTLPVEPWTDTFAKMTANQMTEFERKMIVLRDTLAYADGVADPVAACERLQEVFGEDFPVPARQESASTHPPAIVSSGNSA